MLRPPALLAPALLALALPTAALADGHVEARMTGTILDRNGGNIGSVSLFESASGVVRVTVAADGIPEGGHGIHLHETGVCEGDFSSAGGHVAGDANHGLVEGGPHPGDLPNGFVPAGATALNYEALSNWVSVADDLMDEDGTALIIHAKPDDYESQPSGAAGDRIACAVLEAG